MSFLWNRFLAVPGNSNSLLSPAEFFSHPPALETEDLLLRKPAMKDAKDIFSYASDPEVARYVLWEPHKSLADTRAFLRFLRSRIRNENRSAELGYSFARPYWNLGYATQALKAVVDAVFRSIPLNRLEAQHDIRNPASGRVMEKCGFRQEGILRNRILNKGEYVDAVLYAILRSDWESCQ